MTLERIHFDDYAVILSQRAKQRWKKTIEIEAIKEILHCTQCHSYYVNALCRSLWKLDTLPTRSLVQEAWLNYINTQQNWISDDLARLSPNQRNIMAALAYLPVKEPYSHEFSERVKIGASSVKTALSYLNRHDFVYKDKTNNYRVQDPAIETYLQQIRSFDFME